MLSALLTELYLVVNCQEVKITINMISQPFTMSVIHPLGHRRGVAEMRTCDGLSVLAHSDFTGAIKVDR
jgi:copper(I)-binding protein